MLHILFLAIQQYLLNALAAQNVTYIRIWNNQFTKIMAGEQEDIPYPAIFVEFVDPLDWKTLGGGIHTISPLTIRLHILYLQLDAGGGTLEQNLDIYLLSEQIYKAFEGWEPSTITIASNDPLYSAFAGTYNIPIGMIDRGAEEQDKEHTNVYHWISEFQADWIDPTLQAPVGGSIASPTYNFQSITAWVSGNYLIGAVIYYTDNNIYVCILNTVHSEIPTNATYWKSIGTINIT